MEELFAYIYGIYSQVPNKRKNIELLSEYTRLLGTWEYSDDQMSKGHTKFLIGVAASCALVNFFTYLSTYLLLSRLQILEKWTFDICT